jgi:translation elongation factor EF-Ts
MITLDKVKKIRTETGVCHIKALNILKQVPNQDVELAIGLIKNKIIFGKNISSYLNKYFGSKK